MGRIGVPDTGSMSSPAVFDASWRDPWYLQHPLRAKVVMTASLLVVFGLHLALDNPDLAILYVLPVGLAALAFGLRLGTVAGVLGVGLLAGGVAARHEHLDAASWAGHVVPLLLLGVLAGVATDRIKDARRAEHFFMEVALLQRDNAEVNDSIIQSLTAARWLIESGQTERAVEAIDEAHQVAQGMVARVLGPDSVLGEQVRRPRQVIRRSAGDARG